MGKLNNCILKTSVLKHTLTDQQRYNILIQNQNVVKVLHLINEN